MHLGTRTTQSQRWRKFMMGTFRVKSTDDRRRKKGLSLLSGLAMRRTPSADVG